MVKRFPGVLSPVLVKAAQGAAASDFLRTESFRLLAGALQRCVLVLFLWCRPHALLKASLRINSAFLCCMRVRACAPSPPPQATNNTSCSAAFADTKHLAARQSPTASCQVARFFCAHRTAPPPLPDLCPRPRFRPFPFPLPSPCVPVLFGPRSSACSSFGAVIVPPACSSS